MSISITSFDIIKQLKKDDIVFHPTTTESYYITQTGNDYFLLTQEDEHRAMRMILFSQLISEKWLTTKSNIQKGTLT